MKTLHILCLCAMILLTACKNEEKSPDSQTTAVAVDTTTIQTPSRPDTVTAPWPGKYSGVLPCGDCKGIKTDIEVRADSTYTLSSQYVGKGIKPGIYKGTFHLDQKGIITLDAEGDHLKFQVIDGMLIKRDKFGDPEQGGEEARYYLHPVQ